MTLRRDPNSAAGAWFDTCQMLGWGSIAEELHSPEATVRKWADATSGKEPPLWAIETADRLLKLSGFPPLNTIALGNRIGDQTADTISRLAELERDVSIIVREIEARPNLPSADIVQAALKIIRRLLGMIERSHLRDDRQAQERPKLRAVQP